MFAIALIVWAWAFEPLGIPRDWFYRSSFYAVVGGTVFTAVFSVLAVFSQPRDEVKNPLMALWKGRAQELSLFGERFDVKMYFYVVGGDDAVAQRPVRGRVPLRALWRGIQPGRLPVRRVLHLLHTGLLHLRARPAVYLRPDPREARLSC